MLVVTKPVTCSKCGSTDIWKKVNVYGRVSSTLRCGSCGHEKTTLEESPFESVVYRQEDSKNEF